MPRELHHSLTCFEAHPLASSTRIIFGKPKCFTQDLSTPLVKSSAFSLLMIRMAQYRVA